ncbi:MAG: sigma-70 family RNA polymerase sigma factor [Planctomycetes bacterium]|nr:sigma-70 family RNA polymerase sigma factor [Planctomycetota bacterium]MBU4400194.1 sigma-70 family RNA polymerase sigma factor [Planctomycetota bacterium]MCG2684171.1 sigma-70 family RNA polymerase sigma factor [Planctomycetales bacterium]
MSKPDNHDEPFLVLVTGAQRMLHAFILRLVPSLSDADDILQETNLVLWSKQSEYTPGSDFRAWAFRVARFQVMAYRKRQSLDRLVFGDELVGRLARLGESRGESLDEKRELLIECLQELKDSQRQLLDDHYGDRLSGREIAEKTGRNVDAVFQAMHRAREALLRCIEQGLEKKGTGPICRNGPEGAAHKLDLSPFSQQGLAERGKK